MRASNPLPPPALDARLGTAAAYVRHGGVLADVGCDHGRLSVALALRGRCRKIIASDLRPAPLERARRLAALHDCSDVVECRLGAGLSVLHPGEADDIVIAGVSGVTICEILAGAPPGFFAADPRLRLILVPASKHAHLRGWLAQNGFALLDETPAEAAGRCYAVLCAAYTGTARAFTPLQCAVGGMARHLAGGNASRTDASEPGVPGPAAAEADMPETARAAAGYLLHAAGCLEKEARGAAPDARARMLADARSIRDMVWEAERKIPYEGTSESIAGRILTADFPTR